MKLKFIFFRWIKIYLFSFIFFHHAAVNAVAIGTKSPFLGLPWLRDCSPKMKFYNFMSCSRRSKRRAKINFYSFCHNHDAVNVVSAGIKIYVLVIIYHHVLVNVAGVMTSLHNITLNMAIIQPIGQRRSMLVLVLNHGKRNLSSCSKKRRREKVVSSFSFFSGV